MLLLTSLLCATFWHPLTEPDWFLQQYREDRKEWITLAELRYSLNQTDSLQPLLRRQQQRIYIREYVLRHAVNSSYKEPCYASQPNSGTR